MDEHGLTGLEPHLPRQRDPRREKRQEERRTVGKRGALRQRYQPLRVDRHLLRVAPAGQQRHHAASVLCLARRLGAGNGRELRRLRVVALPDEEVEKIDARGTNAQQGLSLGHVGVGHVLQGQHLGPAGLLDDDCLHSALLTIWVQRADASSTPSVS